MQLHYDAATEEFRTELRAWLEANQPTLAEMRAEPVTSSAHLTGWARRWQRRLFDAGLLVPGWPPELGGRSLPAVQQLVYHEEMARLPVMRTANPRGSGSSPRRSMITAATSSGSGTCGRRCARRSPGASG